MALIFPFYALSTKDALDELQTSTDGLSDKEVVNRLQTYGKNTLTAKKKISPLALYLAQFKNTLTLILIGAALVILFIYQFGGKEQSDLIEAGLILAIVFLITILGFAQEYKAEKAIESLKKLLAFTTKVRRNRQEKTIAVAELVPGDIVLLEEGLKVPADMRLLESMHLMVNESSLTGESVPVSKNTDPLQGTKQLGDQRNMIFSGTAIASGRGVAVVVQTGDKTEIGKIAKSVAETSEEQTPIQKRLDEIGKIISYIILGICVIIFIFIMFFAQEFVHLSLLQRVIQSFIAAVALAVAAIPEGLPAVVTISLALGTQRMLKKNALVRKLNSVETLGSTDTICSDKTGTLTKGEMTVTTLYYADHLYRVTGIGYDSQGTFTDSNKQLTDLPFIRMLEAGLYCNNARVENGKVLGDPTEGALVISAAKAKIQPETTIKRVLEIPFSSDRKMMSVVIKKDNDYILYAKGAPETMIEQCYRIVQNNKEIPIVNKDKKEILEINHKLSTQALRNLGFACKKLTSQEFEKYKHNEKELEKGLTFLGIQGMIDPPREEVRPLISQCLASGIHVYMITGDHPDTARAIATQIGIAGDALTGTDLDKMDEKTLFQTVETTRIYARVNPDTKLRIVAALQANNHIVAMTGDGVNDAPALKKADIGIAMGITGTDVAKEAADMVLLDDKFSTIVAAIEEGRGIFHNIQKFVVYLLSCNLAEVIIIFAGLLILQDLLLTATMLLWINVITDGIPAVALGLDRAEKGIMRYKPSTFQTQIISKKLWLQMTIFSLFLSIFVLGIFVINLKESVGEARAAAFTALVVFELLSIYLIRSNYRISFFANKFLFFSVLATFCLQLILLYTPPLTQLFAIERVDWNDWLFIGLACVWLLFAFQLVKEALSRVLHNPKEYASVK